MGHWLSKSRRIQLQIVAIGLSAMRLEDYAIRIEPLPGHEGGGFLVTVPDLPGCMADGETVQQAIAEARDAFKAWAMAEREDRGGACN